MTLDTNPAPTAPPLGAVLPMPPDVADLPAPEGFYYVIGENGIFLSKQTMFGRVLTGPIEKATLLPKITPTLWREHPMFPADLVATAWGFFRAIFTKQESEALLFIISNGDEYALHCPPQTASMMGVEHKTTGDIPEGFWQVGSIHSHCDFSAFHSDTDTHDAKGLDGLHITLGYVDRDQTDFDAMISVNGIQWPMDADKVLDGPIPSKAGAFPQEWIALVEKEIPTYYSKYLGYGTAASGANYWGSPKKHEPHKTSRPLAQSYKSKQANTWENPTDDYFGGYLNSEEIFELIDIETQLDYLSYVLDGMGITLHYEMTPQDPMGAALLDSATS